jgi:hypothetical protein
MLSLKNSFVELIEKARARYALQHRSLARPRFASASRILKSPAAHLHRKRNTA